ncbi:hypothetical protein SELMODRAFT_408947 [Selaginella moellendorffii]|uniref:Uncharacterized protein n=1 Tax=Selaginella moellendorffii TaxID=88036 RepID=D8R8Z5_SELML|nr:hypothetical protein SELMODRAFT_408947 [Selaginella moellendorffii]
MGFVENAYNVLSPSSLASWPTSASTLQEEGAKNPSADKTIDEQRPRHQQQQQQQVIALDCKSWILDCLGGLRRRRSKDAKNAKNSSSKDHHHHGSGYERPPKWKQAIRKWRAEARKIQSSCYDSMCVDPQPPLHHYKTESYERNFDRGREYWADLPFLDISPFCSPGSVSNRMHCYSSSAMIQQQHGHCWVDLHQEQEQDRNGDDMVWQRNEHCHLG